MLTGRESDDRKYLVSTRMYTLFSCFAHSKFDFALRSLSLKYNVTRLITFVAYKIS